MSERDEVARFLAGWRWCNGPGYPPFQDQRYRDPASVDYEGADRLLRLLSPIQPTPPPATGEVCPSDCHCHKDAPAAAVCACGHSEAEHDDPPGSRCCLFTLRETPLPREEDFCPCEEFTPCAGTGGAR